MVGLYFYLVGNWGVVLEPVEWIFILSINFFFWLLHLHLYLSSLLSNQWKWSRYAISSPRTPGWGAPAPQWMSMGWVQSIKYLSIFFFLLKQIWNTVRRGATFFLQHMVILAPSMCPPMSKMHHTHVYINAKKHAYRGHMHPHTHILHTYYIHVYCMSLPPPPPHPPKVKSSCAYPTLF